MCSNSRFAVALHILVLLALSPEELLISENIAASVNTNPVVIRRLLRMLRLAGIVSSSAGRHGGSKLATTAKDITLWDIFVAVEERAVFQIHAPNEGCFIGRQIPEQIGYLYSDMGQSLEMLLSAMSLDQFVGRFEKTQTLFMKNPTLIDRPSE